MTAGTRQDVVAEARTWLGTKYHHHARIKGVGVDCAQFPAAVYESTGIIPHVEPVYAHDWHLHRDREIYVDWVLKFAREIDPADGQAGDLAIWRWGRTFSHGGILVDGIWVIHAYMSVGVSLDRRDQHEELKVRPSRVFTVWES